MLQTARHILTSTNVWANIRIWYSKFFCCCCCFKECKLWVLALVLCHLEVISVTQTKSSCFRSGWNLVTVSGAHLQHVLCKIDLECKGYFFITIEKAKDKLFKDGYQKTSMFFKVLCSCIFKYRFNLYQEKHFSSILKYHWSSHSKYCYSIWVVKIRQVNPEQTNQTFAPHSVKTNIKIANSR